MQYLMKVDESLVEYVEVNRLPEIYEAVLSGLIVMCPADPVQFMKECLMILKRDGLKSLAWDMFIEESMKPTIKPDLQYYLNSIFDDDEPGGPGFETSVKAYEHYYKSLITSTFRSWMKYILMMKYKAERLASYTRRAETHHARTCRSRAFYAWKNYVKVCKGRRSVAFNLLAHVYNVSVGRSVLAAWLQVTRLSKRAREYFERLERGEIGELIEEECDEDLSQYLMTEGRDDLSLLPNNLAVKIFSYLNIYDLSQCAFVCRSWRILAQNIALLSRVDLSGLEYRVTDRIVPRLLSKCRPYLVHANLRGCLELRTETFFALRECRNLQDLNLSLIPAVTDDTIKLIAEGCRILLYLNISYTNVSDNALRIISIDLANLQYLSIAGCKVITDKGLCFLAEGASAKRLVHLDLSACNQVTLEGYAPLAEGCKNLQHLILNDLPALDDTCLSCFAKHCRKLQSVSLLRTTNVTSDIISKMMAGKKLRQLRLESNPSAMNKVMKVVGKKCRELRYLSIVDCREVTDVGLKGIVLSNLTVLNLTNSIRVTDSGIRAILDGPCGVKLIELNLTNCVCISDLSASNIQRRCCNLTYLSLAYCDRISDAGIEFLSTHQSLHSLDVSGSACTDQGLTALGNSSKLRDISVSECYEITDAGLEKFTQECANLERLDLSYCKNVTDSGVKSLAFNCRFLMHLNFTGCNLLTDKSVQYMTSTCRHLLSVKLSGCNRLSDKSLKYLKDGCYRLKSLHILHCTGISSYAVRRISKYIRQIHYSSEPSPDISPPNIAMSNVISSNAPKSAVARVRLSSAPIASH